MILFLLLALAYETHEFMQKKFQTQYLNGFVKRHPDGFGFFIPDQKDHPDVYVPRESMNGVMTNDRIMISVTKEKGGERFRGELVRVLDRATKKVIGTYIKTNEKMGMLRDDSHAWGDDLQIKVEDSMGAKEGELVTAEILKYPSHDESFLGRVTEKLGSKLDPLTDIKRVVVQNNIPTDFSAATLKEAEALSNEVTEEDMAGRKDLRKLNFITIDGATAKDFDDAIYIETNTTGFKLWVAIADVSHYVHVNAPIDKDAYERGTSVYFPNYVIPMLPEALSNELCSLKPNVPRLALVAEMQMDYTGLLVESSFYEAVIQSKSRVTYGEAQEVIEGKDVPKHKHVREDILRASDLAKILMARRFQEGSLDLEIQETEIVCDAGGVPVDVIKSERLFAHRLIEEMMLAANVAVAKFLSTKDVPAIYRIHESPPEDALMLLEKYLKNFGGKTQLSGGKLQKKLSRALEEFSGKPESQVINILTLRSMMQAKYSSDNKGHFGLGFEFYTHFTSPIRRYPDLIVHRLIKNQIMPNSRYRLMGEEDLSTAATMLSGCEQRSVKAERQFEGIKKARFMEKFVGQEFEGIVSSVTRFGLFVLLRQFEIDGLVRADSISKEKMEYDEENLALVAKRSGLRFTIGDPMKIRVSRADIDMGQVDFEWVDAPDIRKTREELGEDEPRRIRKFDQPLTRRPEKGSTGGRSGAHRNDRHERNDRSGRGGARKPQQAVGSDRGGSGKSQHPRDAGSSGRKQDRTTERRTGQDRRQNDRREDSRGEKPKYDESSPNFKGRSIKFGNRDNADQSKNAKNDWYEAKPKSKFSFRSNYSNDPKEMDSDDDSPLAKKLEALKKQSAQGPRKDDERPTKSFRNENSSGKSSAKSSKNSKSERGGGRHEQSEDSERSGGKPKKTTNSFFNKFANKNKGKKSR